VFISYNNSWEIIIQFSTFKIEIENSDEFINLRSVDVLPDQWKELSSNGGTHGLLGQTYKNKRYSGKVKEIEGDVDDYLIYENEIYGSGFLYNRFNLTEL